MITDRYETQKHQTNENKFILMDHIAEDAKTLTLRGHMVYIRMCERAEDQGGIILPQKSRDEHCTLWEVIAIGEGVDKFRSREKKFRGVQDMDRNAVIDIAVGSVIIIPEKATEEGHGYAEFVKRSPASPYEGSIDKGLILAKVS